MARDVEELAAFRASAERLDSVMREQDRVIERIMSDLQQEMDDRIREVRNLREEAEDTVRTAENKLWHIDHDVRYARSDEDKLDYWQETRRQAVILAEAKAEAVQRAQRAADYEAELLERKKDFDDAVFRVMQLSSARWMNTTRPISPAIPSTCNHNLRRRHDQAARYPY